MRPNVADVAVTWKDSMLEETELLKLSDSCVSTVLKEIQFTEPLNSSDSL